MQERLKSHYESLERAISFVRSADTKAAPILGLQLALVGSLAATSENLWSIVGTPPWDFERVLIVILIATYGLCQISVVVVAARVYIPVNPRTGKSLIYFEDIASMEHRDFETQALAMHPGMIELQLLDQIHRVSRIATIKMGRVRLAFQLSGISFLSWVILLVWGIIRS